MVIQRLLHKRYIRYKKACDFSDVKKQNKMDLSLVLAVKHLYRKTAAAATENNTRRKTTRTTTKEEEEEQEEEEEEEEEQDSEEKGEEEDGLLIMELESNICMHSNRNSSTR